MTTLLLIGLAISVPFFYIYGILCMFRNFSSKKKLTLEALKAAQKKGQTLVQLIDDVESDRYQQPASSEQPIVFHTKDDNQVSSEKSAESGLPFNSNNWYKENSISLLLYLGAFMIVSAAAIFVGFQWEVLSGVVKASLVSLLSLIFFGAGVWFYGLPKVKSAGATFLMIGAVLIPVAGVAWQNFVFRPMGVGPGMVWLVTSVVSAIVYFGLAKAYRNVFYAYAVDIAVLSFSLALVNSLSLTDSYYIVAAMLSCFGLLLVERFLPKSLESEMVLAKSANFSANVIMPLTLLYGFYTVMAQDRIYSIETSLAAVLAGLFYLTAYVITKKSVNLVVCCFFFPLAIVLFCRYLNLPSAVPLYLNAGLAVIYALSSRLVVVKDGDEEQKILYIWAIVVSGFVAVLGVFSDASAIHKTILSLGPTMVAGLVSYLSREVRYLYVAIFGSILTAILLVNNVFKVKEVREYLTGVFLVMGVLGYLGTLVIKVVTRPIFQVLAVACTIYLILGILLSMNYPLAMAGITFLTGILLTHAVFYFNTSSSAIYFANSLFFISLFSIINYFVPSQVDLYQYSPLLFSGLSFLIYAIGFGVREDDKKSAYFVTGLAGVILTPLVSFLVGGTDYYGRYLPYERDGLYGLVSAYMATGLLVVDTFVRRIRNMGYLASVLGMVTYVWQIHYLGVTEVQFYTAATGAYFMVLAYTRKLFEDEEGRQVLDVIGLILLLGPTFWQSLDGPGIGYSLLLGLEAIGLILLGIAWSYRTYKIAGVVALVLAVIPQTYSYILALPRWLVVGGVGLLFVGLAVFLLLKRKED